MLSALLVMAGGVVRIMGRDTAAGAEAMNRGGAAADQLDRPGPAPEADRRSVAVLPLTNLSGDPEDNYFSDGITNEITTTLANVGDFRVINLTSVMRYKDTQTSLQEIAAELGVAHILVSRGQRDGERVRIWIQLVDVATDARGVSRTGLRPMYPYSY